MSTITDIARGMRQRAWQLNLILDAETADRLYAENYWVGSDPISTLIADLVRLEQERQRLVRPA